ncbi:quinoprotein dehydrogenase-associated SoxYZ-like carrier [Pollutimonas bauzanensis]|uniref:quinoprotein dehydrogenase-associated SoxYZ-like carrier n=1 Tax=Pollutimonas bauzanensis TaxID=658167 RepID=UPI00333F64D9
MRSMYRKFRIRIAAIIVLVPMLSFAAEPNLPPDSPMWQKLRVGLFQDRSISDDGDQLITLTAPQRAQDAAVVPVSIKSLIPQTPQRYIKTIHLIVDDNPAPLAAVFHLTPASGLADIETRVRVEQYTYVRAIVETSDGELAMTKAYVKASGGCSAPANRAPGGDDNLGKMKLMVQDNPQLNQPVMAQLMIRHPNASGMVMDQATRLYAPPHYVRRLEVAFAGKPVMTADVDFGISENPNFRFYFTPQAEGTLTARAQDTNDLVFNTSLEVMPE